jgi:hypothetical protein
MSILEIKQALPANISRSITTSPVIFNFPLKFPAL